MDVHQFIANCLKNASGNLGILRSIVGESQFPENMSLSLKKGLKDRQTDLTNLTCQIEQEKFS